MDRLILEEAPVIPLYYDRVIRILQPGIRGLSGNPMNHLQLKRVRKE
jgi:oligopeptide transport system substrate-binding protein